MDRESHSPQMSTPHYPADYDPALNGVGGWLVVVIMGQFATICAGAADFFKSLSALGDNPAIYPLLYAGMIVDIVLYVLMPILIAFCIFTRKIIFRLLFVIQSAAAFVFILIMELYMKSAGYMVNFATLIQPTVAGLIWIAYLYKSKRVKNTYIYPFQNLHKGPTL